MIEYDWGKWGLRFCLSCHGSVFPKAFVISFPNAVAAWLVHGYAKEAVRFDGVDVLWSGYTFVLCFLVVFRTNQAYSRFWEGATLIQQVRGEWFNAVSSTFAFCNPDPLRQEEVANLQNVLVRLMSMLYCAALQQVCDLEDDSLEIIDLESIDKDSLNFMLESPDRCEVLLQWVQRLIADGARKGIIDIPPPILSRAYQELSRGIVNLIDVRKIRDIPFPFPFAQMISSMLAVHWAILPLLAGHLVESAHWAAMACFLVTGALWSLMYIAAEIDQPFGEDPNDLAVSDMQQDMNHSLLTLLEPLAQTPPRFDLSSALTREDSRLSYTTGARMPSMIRSSSSTSSVRFSANRDAGPKPSSSCSQIQQIQRHAATPPISEDPISIEADRTKQDDAASPKLFQKDPFHEACVERFPEGQDWEDPECFEDWENDPVNNQPILASWGHGQKTKEASACGHRERLGAEMVSEEADLRGLDEAKLGEIRSVAAAAKPRLEQPNSISVDGSIRDRPADWLFTHTLA